MNNITNLTVWDIIAFGGCIILVTIVLLSLVCLFISWWESNSGKWGEWFKESLINLIILIIILLFLWSMGHTVFRFFL